MTRQRRFAPMGIIVVLLSAFCLLPSAFAQSATATLSGTVTDQNGAVVPGAAVTVLNTSTTLERHATTNDDGSFTIPLLPPGAYSVTTRRDGFSPVEFKNVVLNVGDQKALKIELKAGDVNATVQVVSEAPLINESPAVATTINRQFVGNLPLNGRSFQSLINLSPGVVNASAGLFAGQFSVNGQRTNANYFNVDGVSANVGVSSDVASPAHFAGSLPALTSFGGTNSLVSVDGLEEFKIETSSYAAEFGRTPGGQVSLVTRSGTNSFHGALFEYFRNDALDANDWFANRSGLKRPALRQNQFGGVVGGRIIKDKLFFFFSYEGLRLRQPRTANMQVPSLQMRQNAAPALRPFLAAYPLPTGAEIGTTGRAPFVATFSDPTTMNAASIRIDHTLSKSVTVFGRYNEVPSKSTSRIAGAFLSNAANLITRENNTRTITVGGTAVLKPRLINEFRVNYSRAQGLFVQTLDNFGGAVPFSLSLAFPSFVSPNQRAEFAMTVLGSRGKTVVNQNAENDNFQRQLNLVDSVSVISGKHSVKFGIDYRRLMPTYGPLDYNLSLSFSNPDQLVNGIAAGVTIFALQGTRPRFTNFSSYAQDTWKINRRLTLNYGLRWEINPAPTEADGKQPFVVRDFQNDIRLATATLASSGSVLWKTTLNNFAPRVGLAYQLLGRQVREMVVRGGFGVYYDLGSGLGADAFTGNSPFKTRKDLSNEPYPLTPLRAEPVPFNPPTVTSLHGFDPNLKLPYVMQWNVAVEQSLGVNNSLTASYVGSAGRRLLKNAQVRRVNSNTGAIITPNIPTLSFMYLTTNGATSDYHALQLQYERRWSRGLQVLASYTWSHNIDDITQEFNTETQVLRGNADTDLRHNFSAAITYDIGTPSQLRIARILLGNWSIDAIVHAQSSFPFTALASSEFLPDGTLFSNRPDLILGVPIYLRDTNAPGGMRINPNAFRLAAAGKPGNLGRNALRGLPLSQVDLALRRRFKITESMKLQFRAEAFNLFNHPNFGLPSQFCCGTSFGLATTMAGRNLGGLNSIYQIGGPRSMQFALRLEF